jgi:4-hydroxy-L-threonine phosphate dehydrogenase PdxA
LHRKLAQKTAILACVLTIAFAYQAQAQDQTSTASLSTASSAQAKPKAKPDAAEAEAGTSEATEALQKATQNPVASLISVPVQKQQQLWNEPRLP